MKNIQNSLSESAWNFNELLVRVDNDHELLLELLAIFKEDFPSTLKSLQLAVASTDLKNAASLSHTLKGMLSNLGGARAATAAAKLEALASAGDASSLRHALDLLEREAAALTPEIEAYMTGVRG